MAILCIGFRHRSAAIFRRSAGLACVVAMGLLVSGCLSVKSYIDPTLPKVAIADLKQPAVKRPIQVFFEYQTNGATNAKAIEYVRPMLIETMNKSNLFSEVVTAPVVADRKLYVTINNVYDAGDAKSKGITTGLTLGMSGTMVTDGFLMNTAYVAPGKDEVKHNYKHALHSTVGNADGPAGLVAVPKADAIHLIIDGLILNLLNDMSRDEELK